MNQKRRRLEMDEGGPLPPHFVVYDHDNPSPAFTPQQVAEIELPNAYLNSRDIEKVRSIETWVLNTNTGWLNSPEIPGLRPDPDRDHCYVRRFSDQRFEDMITRFLGYIAPKFGSPGPPCNMPLFRIILPNGGKYYPIMYHDDLQKWADLLKAAAIYFHTDLGRFDRGRFLVSDGTGHPFSHLSIETVEHGASTPEDW